MISGPPIFIAAIVILGFKILQWTYYHYLDPYR